MDLGHIDSYHFNEKYIYMLSKDELYIINLIE